ncbi:hypothetical protein EDC01DRAFT_653141 [Geopyxis carbonaria]|nr:hypothetical protein EDC01DRAFT_653141 [Geopyxis carbonaria]
MNLSVDHACTFEGCNKAFVRPCRLDEHMRSHTGERPFKCTEDPENCDMAFLRGSHLKAHIKAKHSKDKAHICNFLIPIGKEDDLGVFGFKRKASEGLEGPDGQRVCGVGFTTNQHLKRHMDSHLKTYPYICNEYPPCAAGFRQKGPLHRHVRSEHLGLKPWGCTKQDVEDLSKQCTSAFDTKGQLGNHVSSHHNGLSKNRYICTMCITSTPKQPVEAITDLVKTEEIEDASLLLNLSRQPAFPVFRSPEAKIQDMERHKSQGMRGFTTHKELKSHIAIAHPPVCKFCGHVAKKSRELRIHIREKHEESVEQRRLWMCNWEDCLQDYTTKHNLKTHIRTAHQGLKPFPCTYEGCDLRFGHKSVLENHLRRVHSPGAKPSKKAAQKRKRRTKEMNLLQKLTGVGYEESGRNIKCVVENCKWRFYRVHDLKVHLGAEKAHALPVEEVDKIVERLALEEDGEGEMTTDEETSESEWSAGSDTEVTDIGNPMDEDDTDDDDGPKE